MPDKTVAAIKTSGGLEILIPFWGIGSYTSRPIFSCLCAFSFCTIDVSYALPESNAGLRRVGF